MLNYFVKDLHACNNCMISIYFIVYQLKFSLMMDIIFHTTKQNII